MLEENNDRWLNNAAVIDSNSALISFYLLDFYEPQKSTCAQSIK